MRRILDQLHTIPPSEFNGTFFRTAMDIAYMVTIKNRAYGDAFGQSGKIMAILYPNGISKAQMEDALTVVRIIDKLFRIANHKEALGESPFDDICGYGLLAAVRDEAKKPMETVSVDLSKCPLKASKRQNKTRSSKRKG